MSATVVLGAQWGDEGKGKIVDLLSQKKFNVVARYQGGDNAGHTIVIGNKTHKLNLIPSGVFSGKTVYLSDGMVINPEKFISELDKIDSSLHKNIFISPKATILLPMHRTVEAKLSGNAKIRSTDRGIGPAYISKVSRFGLKFQDLHSDFKCRNKICEQVDLFFGRGDSSDLIVEESMDYLSGVVDRILPFVKKISLRDQVEVGYDVLLEGAQGAMLDIDHGAYPYVTCSNTGVAGVFTGTDLNYSHIDNVVGVTKLYCTKVGGGDFPTKDTSEYGKQMAICGNEFGVVTGRPRDCGWLDLVALKHACQVNGITELAITKCDILNGFDAVKLCIGYIYNSKFITNFTDIHPESLNSVIPAYYVFSGFNVEENTESSYKNNKEFNNILNFIENYCDVTINMVSYGSERNETYLRQ